MDPRHRTLRRVTLPAAESADALVRSAEETFELLMGSDVAPRKDFIVAGSSSLDASQIDA
jgi:DNA gyrase subunit B